MGHATGGPAGFFSRDHRACDDLWAQLEAAVDAGESSQVATLWKRFDAAMRRHFAMEEQVLFPALENATGMHGMGPTAVMRAEHAQMCGVLDQMARDAERGDFDNLLDQGDTLLMLTQQHNVKEEGVLYPLAEQHLAGQWVQLVEKLDAMSIE